MAAMLSVQPRFHAQKFVPLSIEAPHKISLLLDLNLLHTFIDSISCQNLATFKSHLALIVSKISIVFANVSKIDLAVK